MITSHNNQPRPMEQIKPIKPTSTCDDKLVKKCLTSDITIWTRSPIAFCEKENLK